MSTESPILTHPATKPSATLAKIDVNEIGHSLSRLGGFVLGQEQL